MNTTEDDSHGAVAGQVDCRVRPGAEARWCVEEQPTGMPVAQGCAPTAEEASREATRYAMQYAEDGPVRWWVRQNRKTVLEGKASGSGNVEVKTNYGDLRTLMPQLRA